MMVLATACGGETVVVPFRTEPLVYLVLNQPSFSSDPQYQQRALLLTAGSPAAAEYRVADTFAMTRQSDGLQFSWTDMGQRGRLPGDVMNAALLTGNYGLADAPSTGTGGSSDINAGDTFSLAVQTGGATVTGTTTVPPTFIIAVTIVGGQRVAHWPRHLPGQMFSVELHGEAAPRIQAETLYAVPRLTESTSLTVTAMDANLSAYVADKKATSSGVTGAFGVFGAITRASLQLAP